MKTIKKIGLILILIILGVRALAQTKAIDSLRNLIKTESSGKQKLNLIYELAGQSINSDTLLPYIFIANSIATVSKEKFDLSTAAYIRAYYYIRKNFVDSALFIIDRLITDYKDDKLKADFYLGLLFFRAKVFDRGNRYTQALTQLYKVVQEAELQKDTLVLIQAKTGIGWVQMEMEQYPEALNWFYKALNTSTNKKFYKNYGALYSNIASTYNSLHKPDSAQYYINIGIRDARENSNLYFLATSLSMQAKIFTDNHQHALAEAPLNEVVQIRKQLNDPFYTVFDMSNLASYYARNNQTQKGVQLCKEGIMLATKSGLSSQLLMIYHALAENYKAAGNMVDYGQTLEDIIKLKDSFNTINSSRLLADMQANSDAQKKQKEILEQRLNLTQKNYWLFGSALFGLMLTAIMSLAFKNFRRKQHIKMQLALEEEKRTAAQSVIDAEEHERKRIAADLHDNIGAYASAIRADVEKISDSGFEKNILSLQNLQQHSQEIINSLRDTIWVLNKQNITITGIGDRIKNHINKLKPSYNHILFHIHEEIENDKRISSQHALNIFRIVQEALHNALKHSNAANISFLLSSKNKIIIKIEDDGNGINDIQNPDEGNGLLNMKARADEAGFQMEVISFPGKGTSILLQPATTN